MVSSGIEPESRASETLILSIVLRDQEECGNVMNVGNVKMPLFKIASSKELPAKEFSHFHISTLTHWYSHYFINPGALLAKIFTAMASNITPKNFRIAINPAGPNNLSKKLSDFKTANTITRLINMAINIL